MAAIIHDQTLGVNKCSCYIGAGEDFATPVSSLKDATEETLFGGNMHEKKKSPMTLCTTHHVNVVFRNLS